MPTAAIPGLIITGDTIDHYPGFSHDGTRLAFTQGPDSDLTLMVANADGSDVQQLLTSVQWGDFMPSDRQFVVTHTVDGKLVLSIVDVDGQHSVTNIPVGDITLRGWVQPRPPDGGEVIFTGSPHGDATQMGLFAIKPDGTGLRTTGAVVTGESRATPVQISLQDPSLSADGSMIAYWSWEANAAGARDAHIHLRDLDTGADRLFDTGPGAPGAAFPHLSPDGTRLVARESPTGVSQLVIGPVDGSQAPVAVGSSYPYGGGYDTYDFSPDSTKLLLNQALSTSIIDIGTNTSTELQGVPALPVWQRLAP